MQPGPAKGAVSLTRKGSCRVTASCNGGPKTDLYQSEPSIAVSLHKALVPAKELNPRRLCDRDALAGGAELKKDPGNADGCRGLRRSVGSRCQSHSTVKRTTQSGSVGAAAVEITTFHFPAWTWGTILFELQLLHRGDTPTFTSTSAILPSSLYQV